MKHNGKVISFINMKGGIGKTTLCINLCYTLAKEFGKKVLILDLDPQFNTTQALMTKFKNSAFYEKLQSEGKTISHILMPPRGGVAQQQQLHTRLDHSAETLDIIPGDLELISFESSRRGAEKILRAYLKTNLSDIYDYILIDTPATYSIYSQLALLASDYYIVPISPDVFSVLGYSLLQRVMSSDLKMEGSQIRNLGIVFTLTKDRVGRENICSQFNTDPKFNSTISENERIRTDRY